MLQDQTSRQVALVVEDEPAISRACRRVLEGEGYEVDIAINGSVAVEMVNKRRYDLCLSDIRTPAMNGIELYQYLEREHPDLAERVIFTTGDVMSGNIPAFLEAVKRPFLAKPFAPDDLKKIVRESRNSTVAGSSTTER